MRHVSHAALLWLVFGMPSQAAELHHYLFVNLDRKLIRDAAFLDTPALAGAQVKYTWRQLEPARGRYNLGDVLADLAFLHGRGRRLVVQLQDVSFDERLNTPDYLSRDPEFHGGAARKYEARGADDSVHFDGWVARRWDPAVQARFAALLEVLGDSLDGRIEALVLPETAVEFAAPDRHRPAGFTPESYLRGIRAQLLAARAAFPRSHVIQYANFMPGGVGNLKSVYATAESLGVGVGGPDLRPFRKWQRRNSYPLIAGRAAGIVAGVAVQDGNLADRDPVTGKAITVPQLAAFARDSLKLDYVFWGTEEPYLSRDILPWLRARPDRGQR